MREKMPKRGDLLGLTPIAGESLRKGFAFSLASSSGVAVRCKKLRADGGGDIAESIRGEGCFAEDLENPKRDLDHGEEVDPVEAAEAGVSCDGVRLW